MRIDFLIIGQGIAGSLLSHVLMQSGASVVVADAGHGDSVSAASLGLLNPIRGRNLKCEELAADHLAAAGEEFPAMGELAGENWYRTLEQWRLFLDARQRRLYEKRMQSKDFAAFVDREAAPLPDSLPLHRPHGAAKITCTAAVDVQKLLAGWRRYLARKEALLEVYCRPSDVRFEEDAVAWSNVRARAVVFCEGLRTRQNPFFDWVPFAPNKGEWIEIEAPALGMDAVLNRSVHVVPVGAGRYRLGSTYDRADQALGPTEKGREALVARTRRLLSCPFEVTDHGAGIRPKTADNRAVLGAHPEQPRASVFSGLGGFGVLQGPWLARQLARSLLGDGPVPAHVDVARFWR